MQWRSSSKFCSNKLLCKIVDRKNSNVFTKVLKDLMRGQEQDGHQELETAPTTAAATPNFPAFDFTSDLCSDYWSRFCTFANAHSVPKEKSAKVFQTNRTLTTYKMLSNLAAQETPPKDISNLTMEQITNLYEETILSLNVKTR